MPCHLYYVRYTLHQLAYDVVLSIVINHCPLTTIINTHKLIISLIHLFFFQKIKNLCIIQSIICVFFKTTLKKYSLIPSKNYIDWITLVMKRYVLKSLDWCISRDHKQLQVCIIVKFKMFNLSCSTCPALLT